MSNEQDKYNDYDTDERFSSGISHSRRRRAAKRGNGEGKSVRVLIAENTSNEPYASEDTTDTLAYAQSTENTEAENIEADEKAASVAEDVVENPKDISNNTEVVVEDTEQASLTNDKKAKKPKKPMTPVRRFMTVLISILGVYIIAVGVFAISTYFNDNPEDDWSIESNKPIEQFAQVFSPKLPERTQFVIMCTDEDGTRTDTIMVGCYNSTTQGIDIISVPRDTIVSVSAANYETMRSEFPEPGKRTMKINAVHHYAGNDLGPDMLVDELNSLLGTDIQYYVRVNFDAFHYLIDSIGGIDFDVPQDMDYDDPGQDLAIHLKAGMQTLDGDKAEQLVRFRKDNYGGGYFNGDLGRIEMQQNFMKVLVKKLVSVDTIKSNPKAYITTFIKYVKTNAGISDAVKYASALNKLNSDKLQTYTLPGYIDYVDGISGYSADKEETATLVYNIFERPVSEILAEEQGTESGSETAQVADSKSAKIQVLNGGYTNGKAGEVQATLESAGYTVADVGTYNDEKQPNTRIYVNKEGLGDDLKEFFAEPELIVDSNYTGENDIVIVIGTND